MDRPGAWRTPVSFASCPSRSPPTKQATVARTCVLIEKASQRVRKYVLISSMDQPSYLPRSGACNTSGRERGAPNARATSLAPLARPDPCPEDPCPARSLPGQPFASLKPRGHRGSRHERARPARRSRDPGGWTPHPGQAGPAAERMPRPRRGADTSPCDSVPRRQLAYRPVSPIFLVQVSAGR